MRFLADESCDVAGGDGVGSEAVSERLARTPAERSADALAKRLNVEPWIVDYVVLGHCRPKLHRTYMPSLPIGKAREALTRWADEVARILGETPIAQTDAK